MLKRLVVNHHRKFVAILFLLLMSLTMIAPKAQLDGTDRMGNYVGELDDKVVDATKVRSFDIGGGIIAATAKIKTAFNSIREKGKAIARTGAVQTLSNSLFWIFGVVALVIPGFKIVFGGGDKAIEEFISALLAIGFFAAIGIVQYERVVDGLLGMLSDLSSQLSNGAADPVSNLGNIIKGMFDALLKNMPKGITDLIGNLPYFVVSILLMLVAILCAIVALFFILIYLNIGNALIAIAYALGPIFIACGAWSVTKPFFDKWLNFLLIAGMYQVISSLIVTLIAQSSIIPQSNGGDVWSNPANVIFALFIMLALAFLSSMIPEIVNALMPGQIGGISRGGSAAGLAAGRKIKEIANPKSGGKSDQATK